MATVVWTEFRTRTTSPAPMLLDHGLRAHGEPQEEANHKPEERRL